MHKRHPILHKRRQILWMDIGGHEKWCVLSAGLHIYLVDWQGILLSQCYFVLFVQVQCYLAVYVK